jgi:hypothetical protein
MILEYGALTTTRKASSACSWCLSPPCRRASPGALGSLALNCSGNATGARLASERTCVRERDAAEILCGLGEVPQPAVLAKVRRTMAFTSSSLPSTARDDGQRVNRYHCAPRSFGERSLELFQTPSTTSVPRYPNLGVFLTSRPHFPTVRKDSDHFNERETRPEEIRSITTLRAI